MDKKEKIYYSSRFWVWLYCGVFAIYMCLQFILGILGNSNFKLPDFLVKFIIGDTDLPLAILSWGWTALVSLYCGTDRFVDIRNTMALSSGQMSIGELSKLRQIIVLSLCLLIMATSFSLITSKDFQLEALATAFITTVIIYVSGNKLVKSFKYSGEDKDGDGIPDEYQKDYYKWKRKQIKDGVEPNFITFDYFMDEREENENDN